MLRCLFQLADLDPDEPPVRIQESRGDIAVQITDVWYTEYAIRGLNETHGELINSNRWFQLWKGEIVGVGSPSKPRHPAVAACPAVGYPPHITGDPGQAVSYVIDDDLPEGVHARLEHARGRVTFYMSPLCFTPEGLEVGAIAAINAAVSTMLRGGQWIQVWDGEIVTMYPDADDNAA